MEKVIRIKGKEVTTKQGNKFIAFKCKQADGMWVQLSFTKDVNPPKEAGTYDMVVQTEDMNLSKRNDYPVWWCKRVSVFLEPEYEDTAKEAF